MDTDTTIDLLANNGTIDGVNVSILNIQNVYTGDGNDTLTGDTVSNVLNAGRGDDIVRPFSDVDGGNSYIRRHRGRLGRTGAWRSAADNRYDNAARPCVSGRRRDLRRHVGLRAFRGHEPGGLDHRHRCRQHHHRQ